jgi:hypothetical protein
MLGSGCLDGDEVVQISRASHGIFPSAIFLYHPKISRFMYVGPFGGGASKEGSIAIQDSRCVGYSETWHAIELNNRELHTI